MTMNEFVVEGKGLKLSVAIRTRFPKMQYGTLQKLFRKGDVRLNGTKIFSDKFVNAGDIVRVFYEEERIRPKLLFEDKHVAVFYKPPKIATVGENSFEEDVRLDYPSYIACHRLDTNTDGLVVFGKDAESAEAVKAAFKSHLIEKHYLTFVFGEVTQKKRAVAYLKKDERLGVVRIYNEKTSGAAKIVTDYGPIAAYKDSTCLDVSIVTGKTHQIRAHLAHEGFPVIGDPKYGKNDVNRAFGKSYQMLTAYKLIFHTESGLLASLNGQEVTLDVRKMIADFEKSQKV